MQPYIGSRSHNPRSPTIAVALQSRLSGCGARKLDHHRGLEEGRDEDAYFAPVGSSEIVHLPRRYRLMDWSNSDGLTGSFQAAREYSLMRPWSRCPRTITPPSGIG